MLQLSSKVFNFALSVTKYNNMAYISLLFPGSKMILHKAIITIIAICLMVFNRIEAQVSRYHKPEPRDFSTGYKQQNNSQSNNNQERTNAYTPKYQNKMTEEECITGLYLYFRNLYTEDNATMEVIEPYSTWIDKIEYYESNKSKFNIVVLYKTNRDAYIFKMERSMWERWKYASSQGEFYNLYIKDNPSYSISDICK